jgi:PAS domain S-box-containing protein
MKNKDNRNEKAAELRSQAEAKLSERKKKAAPPPAKESDSRRLVHELEVHQIELEMQNEELVQARANMEALLSQYTDLYDFAPVGYFTLARDSVIHQVNLAGSTLLGVERGALIKRRFGLFVSVESRPIFNDFLAKVFSTSGSKETCQVTLMKEGHRPLWAHIEATRIEDGQECRAVVSDITERKRAEEALSDSEMRYRRLFETAQDGILILDAETGKVVDVNPFLVKVLGYSHEQFVGKQIWELGLLKDVVANRDKFAELQRQEYVRYEDLPLVTGDGRQIEVEFISNVYSVDHSKVIQCNIRNITERKQTQDKLSVSEVRYRRLFETAQDGILILDAETGIIVDVNPFLIEMLGYSHEQFVGKRIWDLGCLKDVVANRDKFAELQRQEYVRYEDLPLVTGDGRQIEVEFISNVYSVDHNKVIQCNIRNVTERKRAEEALKKYQDNLEELVAERTEALRESENNFRRSQEGSPLGIRIITSGGELLYANQAILDIYGYDSVEELEATPHKKSYTPESYAEHQVRLKKRQRGEYVPPNYEISIIHKDGKVRHLEVFRKEVLWNGETQFQVLYNDITERKRVEKELIFNNVILSTQQETSLDGILVVDEKGTIISCNRRFIDMWDIPPDVVVSKSDERAMQSVMNQLIDPEEFMRKVQKLYSNRQETSWDEIALKDGRTFDRYSTPMLGADGRYFGRVWNFRDITERKWVEEALRTSEKKYRQLIETLQEGIWVIDKDTITTFVNPRMAEMLGYTIEEMLGKPLFSFMDERGVEIVKYNMERRKQGIAEQHDFEFLRKDGSRVYATMETSPLTDEKGNFVGALAGVVDITGRKLADAKRLELERKYLISSRLASIGEMAAGIAHEINNPLSPIIGFADLLLKEDLPEAIKADLQIIRDCANRAAAVTKGLLVFARQSKPMRKLCSINELVETTIQLRIYHLKTNNVIVIKELDPELPETMVDAAQMQQVLLNLIMNAEYEMNKAHVGGNLTIKTERTDNIIRVLVKDDGQGISSENMEKLFQPFFTTKKVGDGTGLGLSVCHGIVAEHNGRIYAESDEGNGATFIVELPILRQEEETKPSESDVVKAEETVGARILVVDDEPSITQVLKRVLTAEGYDVETTNKASDALNMIKGGKSYALILLDIKLPDMSGIELYQHLGRIATSLTRRIIFVTGDVLGADTMDFFSRTKAFYITKPFDIVQLKKDVKSKLTEKA